MVRAFRSARGWTPATGWGRERPGLVVPNRQGVLFGGLRGPAGPRPPSTSPRLRGVAPRSNPRAVSSRREGVGLPTSADRRRLRGSRRRWPGRRGDPTGQATAWKDVLQAGEIIKAMIRPGAITPWVWHSTKPGFTGWRRPHQRGLGRLGSGEGRGTLALRSPSPML